MYISTEAGKQTRMTHQQQLETEERRQRAFSSMIESTSTAASSKIHLFDEIRDFQPSTSSDSDEDFEPALARPAVLTTTS